MAAIHDLVHRQGLDGSAATLKLPGPWDIRNSKEGDERRGNGVGRERIPGSSALRRVSLLRVGDGAAAVGGRDLDRAGGGCRSCG